MVRTLTFHLRGHRPDPGSGNPTRLVPRQKKKKKKKLEVFWLYILIPLNFIIIVAGGSDSERGRAWRVPGTVPLHVAWAHQAGGKGRLSSARTVHGSGQRGCLRGSNVPQSKRPRRTRWRLPSQAT